MIHVQELRLGNFLYEEVLGICPVILIQKNSVWVSVKHMDESRNITDKEYHLSQDSIEPIPLTAELLVKCGFTDWSERIGEKDELGKDVTSDWIRYALNPVLKNDQGIEWYDRDLEVDLNDDGTWHVDYHCVTIKYLHQLQNLFFALKGIELTISLQ